MKHKTGYFFLALLLILASCKKYKDNPGDPNNPLLNRPYCNDPAGVNYNWNFPGKPDNSTCIYPTDVFKGDYTYTDSIYNGSQVFIRQQVLNLSINASSRTKMTIAGFCSSGSLSFTAARQLRADGDTLNLVNGQPLCRPQDTLSGTLTRPDINGPVIFNLTVTTDTGIAYHRGSAVRK